MQTIIFKNFKLKSFKNNDDNDNKKVLRSLS